MYSRAEWISGRFATAVLVTMMIGCSGTRSETPSEPRGRMAQAPESTDDDAALIREATDVFRSLAQGADRKIPDQVLDGANCVAIFPKVVTAALVIGGTYGRGVASCKISGRWSQPAFVEVSGGSLGVQAGGKTSDLLLLTMDKDARDALKAGRFNLGTDASVVAGGYDSSFSTQGTGVIAYSRNEGIFGGAALTGLNVSKDDDAIHSYYGSKVSYLGLMSGQEYAGIHEKTSELTSVLPR